ncbi:MAG TPA: 1-deoxy-D-xylulose-5-phosphate synthase [Terriglobales bacterium]|nr:1-deoxy-D-xylulose-5-phosphate synthase [Terriglobales bacterium]
MEYRYLTAINSPDDLKKIPRAELPRVAEELRDYMIATVSKVGGHLASSLGVVELTIALHYLFDAPADKIVWDVGHQAYGHKILTGRRDRFPTLRQYGGISGFPVRDESPYDAFNVAHACTSISAALGMCTARDLAGEKNHVVAVIGDAGLTGGVGLEGLNQAGHLKPRLLVILNDNEMSISPNVGALSGYLNRIAHGQAYQRIRDEIEALITSVPRIGKRLFRLTQQWVEAIKGMILPGLVFEELGFEYVGPINGHNIETLLDTLNKVKDHNGPVLLHVVTRKGKGYPQAEELPMKYHGVTAFDISTGAFVKAPAAAPSYTSVFGQAMCERAEADPRVVAITAAMAEGTGLSEFAERFPKRFFDVGIAEQHAVTFAAGLACEGLRPVCAIYSTFLQRAYDQVIHDVCLMNLPVTFALDRGGIVGADGPTHHGLYDLAYLAAAPNMTVMAPKDENELRHMLHTSLEHGAPIAFRYPRGNGMGVAREPLRRLEIGRAEILREGGDGAILALGSMVYPALEAAKRLAQEGLSLTVINARFVKPLDEELIACLAAEKPFLVTAEEGTLAGGFGALVTALVQDRRIPVSILRIGVPDRIIPHGAPALLHAKYGLDADGLAERIRAFAEHRQPGAGLAHHAQQNPPRSIGRAARPGA